MLIKECALPVIPSVTTALSLQVASLTALGGVSTSLLAGELAGTLWVHVLPAGGSQA